MDGREEPGGGLRCRPDTGENVPGGRGAPPPAVTSVAGAGERRAERPPPRSASPRRRPGSGRGEWRRGARGRGALRRLPPQGSVG